MNDEVSKTCDCDAVDKELDVYEDENAPYTTHWAVINKDKKSDYYGEVEHAKMISADECNDLEQAIAIGLEWLRSKEYKMMECINKHGVILVANKNGIHVYEKSCEKLTRKVQ